MSNESMRSPAQLEPVVLKQLFRDEQGDSQKVPRMDCLLVQETMAFGASRPQQSCCGSV